MEKVKGGLLSHVIVITLHVQSTTVRFCPRLPFLALILHKHERQNDVIQHIHPCGLDFESGFLFIDEVVCVVEFSNYRFLLISGDQLHTVVRRSASRMLVRRRTDSPWEGSSPSPPSPIYTERRLAL